MKIKVFTLNSNGKIEISEEELRKLLDDSYWEGYYDSGKSWTCTSPNINPVINPYNTWLSNKITTTSATNDVSGENNAK